MTVLLIFKNKISSLKKRTISYITKKIKYFEFIHEIQNPTQPITFDYWYNQKINSINIDAYWPVHKHSRVIGISNILIGKGSFPGYMPGCYIQGIGKIIIGKYCIFAPNVGIISSNHNVYNHSQHECSEVVIGSYSWVGMNAVILPGVILGDFTIVAAGAVVSKSFPEGYCIIGGNPAKIIKNLSIDKCVRFEMLDSKFRGYVKESDLLLLQKKN